MTKVQGLVFLMNVLSDPQQLEAGRQELVALGDDIDETLNRFLDVITDWAEKAREEHDLSDTAVAFLLHTAPDALNAYVAGLGRREPSA